VKGFKVEEEEGDELKLREGFVRGESLSTLTTLTIPSPPHTTTNKHYWIATISLSTGDQCPATNICHINHSKCFIFFFFGE